MGIKKHIVLFFLLLLAATTYGQRLPLPIGTGACNISAITGILTVTTSTTTQLSDATAGGTWSSSATAVATVGTAGLVTGVSAGTATISYSKTVNCYAVATVTVSSGASYSTWSPTNKSSAVTLTSSNSVANGSGSYGMCIGTVGFSFGGSGKIYYEIKQTTRGAVSESIGISDNVPNSSNTTQTIGRVSRSWGIRPDAGNWDYSYNDGSGWNTAGSGTHSAGNGAVFGFAVDKAGQKIDVYQGNVLMYTWSSIPTGITFYPAMVSNTGSNVVELVTNPANMTYSPPAGYTAGL